MRVLSITVTADETSLMLRSVLVAVTTISDSKGLLSAA